MIIRKSFRQLFYTLLLLACIPTWWSCGNVRQFQYFQGQFDTAKLSQANYPKLVVQKGDLLNIAVYSDNPQASAYYNLPNQPSITAANSTTQPTPALNSGSTYLVDDSGYIQFPGLGNLMVAGLGKDELYQLLKSKLTDKLNNPYFIIRLANYRITLIGEVAKPGQFTIPNERVSLLEAIGLAGDLTSFGRRDNVLVLREINGQRTQARLDLKNPEIMASPFFYLQPNDVVYVDMTRNKAAANDQVTIRNISLATSVISVLAILVGVLR
ncbi:MAG: polysaccharide biosynthesis/export family protein [Chitinophagaceae bacterium]